VTYEKIFDLKFHKGCSTHELMHRFPEEADKVSRIALLQIPDRDLKRVVREARVLERILALKRRFFRRKK